MSRDDDRLYRAKHADLHRTLSAIGRIERVRGEIIAGTWPRAVSDRSDGQYESELAAVDVASRELRRIEPSLNAWPSQLPKQELLPSAKVLSLVAIIWMSIIVVGIAGIIWFANLI